MNKGKILSRTALLQWGITVGHVTRGSIKKQEMCQTLTKQAII